MYKQEIELQHNEIPGKINKDTGEFIPINKKNVNNGMSNFKPNHFFNKAYSAGWQLLDEQTTDKEFALALRLSFKIKPFSNSIMPLGPNIPVYMLGETLNTDRRIITKMIDKMIDLGVIALFEVKDPISNLESTMNGFWVFNPYLSFNGKTIVSRVLDLFADSNYAKLIKN